MSERSANCRAMGKGSSCCYSFAAGCHLLKPVVMLRRLAMPPNKRQRAGPASDDEDSDSQGNSMSCSDSLLSDDASSASGNEGAAPSSNGCGYRVIDSSMLKKVQVLQCRDLPILLVYASPRRSRCVIALLMRKYTPDYQLHCYCHVLQSVYCYLLC